MFVKIEKNVDGSHTFQAGGALADGWAVVPVGMALPSTFPFVTIQTAVVTYPAQVLRKTVIIDGRIEQRDVIVRPEFSRVEVTSMTEGEEISLGEEPPSEAEKIAELQEALDLLLSGVTE